MSRWTQEELGFLKENYVGLTYDQIASILGRSYSSVKGTAQRRLKISFGNLSRGNAPTWTEAEVTFIVENYEGLFPWQMASILGRPEVSVQIRLSKLKIKAPPRPRLFNAKQKYESLKREGICITCRKHPRTETTILCSACTARNNARQTEYRALVRSEVLRAYGGKCECCGEREGRFLTIDHINGRKSGEETGMVLYARLYRGGFPKEGLRLLCWNCNIGRDMNGGRCPHED